MAVHPSRFISFGTERFSQITASLNEPLSFIGLEFGLDGKFRNAAVSATIEDAQKKANTLLQKLQAREVHSDIITIVKRNC